MTHTMHYLNVSLWLIDVIILNIDTSFSCVYIAVSPNQTLNPQYFTLSFNSEQLLTIHLIKWHKWLEHFFISDSNTWSAARLFVPALAMLCVTSATTKHRQAAQDAGFVLTFKQKKLKWCTESVVTVT